MSNPDDIVGTLLVGVALAALVILIVAFTAHFTAAMSRGPGKVRVDDRWVVTEGPAVAAQRSEVAVPRPRRPSHPQQLPRPDRPSVGTASPSKVRADGGRN
jgi:hypothetical protein